MPKLPKWLSSTNDTVVMFALKLAEVYQQFQVKSKVEECLFHTKEAVRVHAVNTLARIGDETSADRLIAAYKDEHFTNRLNILNKIHTVATARHIPFLLVEMNNDNDFLKLAAARAIGELGELELIAQKAILQPSPYEQIYQHVKAEIEL
jgi:HEAT repeat protein